MQKTTRLLAILLLAASLLAACSLPLGQPSQPPAPPATEAPPTEAPATEAPTPQPAAAAAAITPENAAQLAEAGQIPVFFPQGLVWSPDSQAFGFYVSDASLPNPSLYTARLDSLPAVTLYQAPAGQTLYDLAPDLRTAAISPENTRVVLTDITSGTALQTIVPGYTLYGASFSPDGRWLVTNSADQWETTLWEPASGAQVKSLTGFETAAPVYGALVGGDNATLLWFARATLQTQDIASGQMGATFSHEDFISAFALCQDGNLLVTAAGGTYNGAFTPLIFLWNARSGAKLAEIPLPASAWALALSPDGRLLAVAIGSQVLFFDTTSQQQVAALGGHSDTVNSLLFSPDGSKLLTSSSDNTVRVWMIP